MDAAVDTMVVISFLEFPADSKFLASGSDVKVLRAYGLQFPLMVSSQWCSPQMRSSSIPPECVVGLRLPRMCIAGVCAAVDTMVLIDCLAFPADSKFLASGSDVKVVRAYRLLFPLMVSRQWCSPQM